MGEHDSDLILRWIEETRDASELVELLVDRYNVLDMHDLLEILEEYIMEIADVFRREMYAEDYDA